MERIPGFALEWNSVIGKMYMGSGILKCKPICVMIFRDIDDIRKFKQNNSLQKR